LFFSVTSWDFFASNMVKKNGISMRLNGLHWPEIPVSCHIGMTPPIRKTISGWWWLTHLEKWWSSSMRLGWHPIYDGKQSKCLKPAIRKDLKLKQVKNESHKSESNVRLCESIRTVSNYESGPKGKRVTTSNPNRMCIARQRGGVDMCFEHGNST
jgi:hypothetical protein